LGPEAGQRPDSANFSVKRRHIRRLAEKFEKSAFPFLDCETHRKGMGRWRTERREPVLSRPTAVGAVRNWGDEVDRSILERQINPGADETARGRAVEAIGAAWRALATAGRGLTVAGVVVALILTGWWVAESPAALATGACLLVLIAAALVDAVEHRLPNALVALAFVPVGVALVASAGALLPGALLGAAWIGGPLLLTHLVSPAGMGFGDVKAGAVLGAGLGLLAGALAPLTLVIGLALGAGYGLARRAGSIPLGPALVAGALLALALTAP
jgi:hypothetical protein